MVTVGEMQDRVRALRSLDQIGKQLQRIADALDRLAPPEKKKEA